MIRSNVRQHAAFACRALALVVGLALLPGCRADPFAVPSPAATRTPTPPPPADAESALATFYDRYLSYPGNALARRAYRNNENLRPFLTDDFVKEVDAALELVGEQGGAYDPFVCAQDIPTSLDYQVLVSKDTTASVLVQRYFYGTAAANNMVVDLTRSAGHWQIEDVSCSGGLSAPLPEEALSVTPAPTPSDVDLVYGAWEPFTSTTYGFSMRHPAVWDAYEVPNDSGYAADPVDGYVEFTSSAGPVPVGLVISTAPLEEWRAVFPAPEAPTVMTFGSTEAQLEEQFGSELYYVITHPQDATRRVALRVVAGGDISPGALAEVVATMLRSFRFED